MYNHGEIGEILNDMDNFIYFGSICSRDLHIDDKADIHISRTSSVFAKL